MNKMMSSANCVVGSCDPVRPLTEVAEHFVALVSLGQKFVLFLFYLKSVL